VGLQGLIVESPVPHPPAEHPLEYRGGLHLKSSILWLDASEPRPISFVSHAGIAGSMLHQKIVTTERTAEILRAVAAAHGRGRHAHEPQALVTPFGRTFSLGPLSLELFPSGHLPGSASLLLRHEGLTLVYAGEINSRRSPLSERIEARPCDLLALPCRFGSRRFVFPPQEKVQEAIVHFAKDALVRGTTPIFLAAPVGEAQELAALLLAQGVKVRAHRKIFAVCRAYARAGLPVAGVARHHEGGDPASALLWPADLRSSSALARLLERGATTAFVSGMALDEEVRSRAACDAAFVLSTHADYKGLLEYVRVCKPKRVILVRGIEEEIGKDLEALGMSVSSLGPVEQMDLF
jgi:Cft2 family RNA processing exonuclease